jgi:malate dehydrogenase
VPCVLGRHGVEKVIEVELEAREKEMFDASVQHVKDLCAATRKYLPK